MSLAQRIKMIRKSVEMNQTDFANEIGITQTSLSQIEGEKNGISYDVFKAIVERFHVDPTWLMDGKGEMFRSEQSARKPGSVMPLVVTVADDGEENIVMVDKKAAAGYLQHQQDPEYMAKLPSFRLPGYYGRTFRAFEVTGTSMMPGIHPGDMLVGAYEDSLAHLRAGQVYVVVLNDGSIVAKRVRPSGFNRFELSSDNKEYQPYEVSAEDIAQIWHVQARITKSIDPPESEKPGLALNALEKRLAELEKKIKPD
ncbi:MAG: hypothetical protein Fur0041_22440 [Bacteroidia bacterium]